MHSISPTLIRSAYIGKVIKDILHERNISITEISNKVKLARPSVSNALNGKSSGSDSMYLKILEGVGLNSIEIKNIFKDADKEEFLYKYNEDISCSEDMSYEEIWDIIKKKENLNDQQMKAIEEFIQFQKTKNT